MADWLRKKKLLLLAGFKFKFTVELLTCPMVVVEFIHCFIQLSTQNYLHSRCPLACLLAIHCSPVSSFPFCLQQSHVRLI